MFGTLRSRDAPILLVFRCAALAGLAFVVMAVASRLRHVNHTTVALAFVLMIVGVSTRWGWVEALATSLAGGIAFDYYMLPPRGFDLGAPEYAITLVAFLVTAITIGQLSASAHRHRIEAERRRDEMAGLYRLSHALFRIDDIETAPQRIVQEVLSTYGARAAALFERDSGRIFECGAPAGAIPDEKLREVSSTGCRWDDPSLRKLVVPVLRGGSLSGSLGIAGVAFSRSVPEAIAERVGVALERARTAEEAVAAELVRRSENLKSAVLDALAHEIKGPLGTIKVSVSTLLSQRPGNAAQQRELLTIVDEELERIGHWIDSTIQVSRREANVMRLDKRPTSIKAVAARALDGLGPLAGRAIDVRIPDQIPEAPFDAEMIERVIRLLLDNALKYSPPGSPIGISAEFTGAEIVLSVEDHGWGVPDGEKERIFEKYYRGSKAQAVPGTGLGLASARCIMEAHGGEIWVTGTQGSGSVFHISLPVTTEVSDERLESLERG